MASLPAREVTDAAQTHHEDRHVWDNNDQDCFPRWTVNGSSAGYGAFNKFLVDSVTQYDIAIPAPENWMSIPIVTEYDYIGTPTAHYDEFIYLNLSHKTWSEPRGYGEVVVRSGTGSASTYMATRHRFFRGMHGDNNGSGGTRSVPLAMDDGTTVNDDSWLRGREYDTEVLDPGNSNVVMEQDNWFFTATPTATWNSQTAYRVDTVRARHWSQEGAGYFQTQVQTSYDTFGMPIQIWDEGDVTTTADDTCTSRQYVRTTTATDAWMLDRVIRAGKAGGTPSNPGGDFGNCVESAELSRVENFYDAQTFGNALATGRLTSSNTRATISSPARTTSFTYDTAGRVTQTDGRRIDVTDVATMTYDSAGFPTRIVDATGHAITTRVDHGTGNTLATIDENNTTANGDGTDRNTYYQYDALGRAVAVFTPDNGSYNAPAVKNTYSLDLYKVAAPKVRTDTNQSAGVDLTVFTYFDGLGRQRETQRPSPAGGRIISATQYDGAGLAVRTFTDQYQSAAVDSNMWTAGPVFDGRYLDSETITTFDHLARPTATTRWGKTGAGYPGTGSAVIAVNGVNVATTYAYSGHTTTVTPPGTSATATHTNALGQTDALYEYNTTWSGAKVTTYAYNLNRQQTSVTDPLGNISSTVYDNWGRVTDTHDPDRGHTALTYFDDGTVNTATYAAGTGTARTITYTTDALGRVTNVANGATTLERYAWDATGEAGLSDYSESVFSGANIRVDTLGYDARKRPLGTSYIIPSITNWTSTNGLAGTYTYNNIAYDRADHVTSYTSAALGALTSETVTNSYTSLGMPNALTGSASYVTASTYTGQGWVASRTLSTTGTNVVRNYVWDLPNARLDSINATQGATVLQNDVQLYNANGTLRGSIHDRVGTASDHGECYFYDGRQRLTAAYTNNTTTTAKDCSYTSTGGLTPYNQTYTYNEIGNITAGPAGSYTYPASGGSSIRPHAATTVGTATLTYNNDGTRATSTTSGTATNYTWDPLEHLNSTATSGNTTSMAYLPGGQRVLIKDTSGVTLYLGGFAERQAATSGVKTEKRYFTIGSNTVAVKTRPSSTGITTTDYLIGDIRGSVTLTIPRAGGATSERWYQPYGDTRGSATTPATNRAYVSQYQDTTKLIYLNNRYYDPSVGVFLSVDPLVASTGDPYLYAAGNPTTLPDPSGLCTTYQGGGKPFDDGEGPCGGGGSHGSCAGGCSSSQVRYEPRTLEVYVPPDHDLSSMAGSFFDSLPLPVLIWASIISPGELQPMRLPRIFSLSDETLENVRAYDSALDGVAGALDDFLKVNPKYGNLIKGPVAAGFGFSGDAFESAFVAASGERQVVGAIAPVGRGSRLFAATANSRYVPLFDAEIQGLEYLAAQLDASGVRSGSLDVVLNRPPCSSCTSAFNQFQQRYPGVDITVRWISNIILTDTLSV